MHLEKVDITVDKNRKWRDLYEFEIPVFHFNGKFLMKNHVNVTVLRRAIEDFNKANELLQEIK